MLAAVLLFAAGCSQAPEGGAAAGNEDPPEVRYRKGVMQAQAFKAGVLRDMADGAIDADADLFAEYAADQAALWTELRCRHWTRSGLSARNADR